MLGIETLHDAEEKSARPESKRIGVNALALTRREFYDRKATTSLASFGVVPRAFSSKGEVRDLIQFTGTRAPPSHL